MTLRIATPITVGRLTLPNRMIMGSMHLGFETEPDAARRLAGFYAERARGGIGLIVTGGVAPNPAGRFGADGCVLNADDQLDYHRTIADAVHAEGGRILMQSLHCGRYGRHDGIVAPSAVRAPINPVAPRELSDAEIMETVSDYARSAALAIQAGYDGIEVMASEGYLISEFLAPATNHRADRWGGSLENRLRFLAEVVAAVRGAIGDAVLSVRLSMVDLVQDGAAADEVVAAAKAAQAAGADLLNTGIGWHESRVPTIAHSVPAGGWTWATARVRQAVTIPVSASNRIDTPAVAEAILERGDADMVSMARPLLADPAFAAKAVSGRAHRINVCIACNQGCLDNMFDGRAATCLVNPRAGREDQFVAQPMESPLRIAIVGGGPAGMACAIEAAKRGHAVTLFEAGDRLGGQFALADRIPGKANYRATLDWFAAELAAARVAVRLGTTATADMLAGFDRVVVACGVKARWPRLEGIDHPKVAGYEEILAGRRMAGRNVALIGAGPIAFDVALALLDEDQDFDGAWGVDREFAARGGLAKPKAPVPGTRRITLMQRSPSKPGGGLGKTTGWIVKAKLQKAGVAMLSGVSYLKVGDDGLHVAVDGEERVIPADTVVVCSGQEPDAVLADALDALGKKVYRIGGARDSAGIDALRAIEEGTRLGLSLV
jgi:2,4-dienoyl-CoA reductase (NADPH2)